MKKSGNGGAEYELMLKTLRIEENLKNDPILRLFELLNKYWLYFSKRSSKCKVFEYKFEMQGELTKSCNSRAIPFARKREVKEQIQEMIWNGILEISCPSYVNPLTLVERKKTR
jgi:hypothetical protein